MNTSRLARACRLPDELGKARRPQRDIERIVATGSGGGEVGHCTQLPQPQPDQLSPSAPVALALHHARHRGAGLRARIAEIAQRRDRVGDVATARCLRPAPPAARASPHRSPMPVGTLPLSSVTIRSASLGPTPLARPTIALSCSAMALEQLAGGQRREDRQRHARAHPLHRHQRPEPGLLGLAGKAIEPDHVLADDHLDMDDRRMPHLRQRRDRLVTSRRPRRPRRRRRCARDRRRSRRSIP